MTPAFVRWAGRQLRPWRERMEARQRQERFARLLRIDPSLKRAHEALERDRKRHAPTRADIMAMRDALHAELKRELRHG